MSAWKGSIPKFHSTLLVRVYHPYLRLLLRPFFSNPRIDTDSYHLLDLTATLIATMISGHSYLNFFIAPTIGIETGNYDILQDLQSDINFIRKTLNMARISCTSLVVSLWYVDTFFHHKSKRRLRIRKLDDESSNPSRVNPAEGWSTRDLFMASIVIADKYL